jgi:hypothetical protein
MSEELDKYQKKHIKADKPTWIKSETTRVLYIKAMELFESIKQEMSTTASMPLRSRKIVLRRLAIIGNVNHSLITPRRQPDLVEFINKKNAELEVYWSSLKASHSRSGRKMTKSEIVSQFNKMKTEIENLTNLRLAEALTAAIRENLAESKSALVAKIEEHELEIARLKKENMNLRLQNQELISALNKP